MDTIFAVSSGAPPAAIAVLRVSGEGAFAAAEALAGSLPDSRRAGVRALHHPESGELLDRALVLVFPGAATATGEDLVELHLHGGRAVVRAVEAALATLPGLRQAEAGEFTRRALMNGRLDLSEAEGLGDLLAAETEAQRKLAIRSAEGAVRRQVEGWTRRLLVIAAQVEALLDHSDESDVENEADSIDALHHAAEELAEEIDAVVERPSVERLKDGVRVTLAGPPNAGKSTLFNALVEREAAIVSPIAGTTRDRIEAAVVRNGMPFLFTDTAGLAQQTNDPIEAVGIARAQEASEAADILLWLGDGAAPPHGNVVLLHPRSDVAGRGTPGSDRLSVSSETGFGLDALWAELDRRARSMMPPTDLVALNKRQRDLSKRAADALARAAMQQDMLFFAEELRTARAALDGITGKAGVECVLDALFLRFCIGK